MRLFITETPLHLKGIHTISYLRWKDNTLSLADSLEMPCIEQWLPQPPSLANQSLRLNSIKAIDWLAMFVLTAIFVYMVFAIILVYE